MDPTIALVVLAAAIVAAAAVYALVQLRLKKRAPFLNKTRKRIMIMDVLDLSPDVKRFRLSLGSKETPLGLPVGKHIRLFAPNPEACLTKGTWNGRPDADKGAPEIQRFYTPTPSTDSCGYVELAMKIYRPGTYRMPDGKDIVWEDGGKMSMYMDGKKPGDYVEIAGPWGVHEYLGSGSFKVPGAVRHARHFGLLAGGAGITPMLQLVHAALRDPDDSCRFTLLYANKTEDDILCRDLLELEARGSGGRFKLHYTLDFPPEGWAHKSGFITAEMIKECSFPPPAEEPMILLCGPPPMIEFACKKNLASLGYDMKRVVAF